MTTTRVLLSCTALSLQDTCFMYPCCKCCLSRLIEESDLRSRCPKCGFRYEKHNMDYRYRLSLMVYRDKNIFGVTVFGGCLNSFFGITAGDLQRFVHSTRQGQQSLKHLLIKAVEDCFIGKCFVFGFKDSGLDGFLFHERTLQSGFSSERAQFVACQIILPNGAFLGITVFAYLQRLLEACCLPHPCVSTNAVSQQRESLVSSFEDTLPLCSETSGVGLTLSRLWQPSSDLVLCFSPEEKSGQSLQRLTMDEVHNELSCLSPSLVGQVKNEDGTFKQFESSSVVHNSHYTSNYFLSTVPSMADKSDSSAVLTRSVVYDALNPTTTISCGLEPERPLCTSEKISGRECSTSFLETSLFSYSVQNGSTDLVFDAPLSETLRGFINLEPQISKEVNTNVLRSANKCSTHKRSRITPQNTNCVLFEDHMVSGCSSDIQALCSYQSVVTPLHSITNIIRAKDNEKSLKRKHTNRKVLSASKHILPNTLKASRVPKDNSVLSCHIKDANSKINNLRNYPSSATCWIPNDQTSNCFEDMAQVDQVVCPEMESQCVQKEITFGRQGDEYNCSADLFSQNTTDTTERSVSDLEIKKDSLLDISVSGLEVLSSFHFEPSLQSTPRASTFDQCSYGQSCKRSKNGSNLQRSKKRMKRTSVRVMRKQSDIRQGPTTGKTEFSQSQSSDFSCKNHESSAGGLEVEGNTEHEMEDSVVHTNINEWSRDLFAY
ncbi:DNA damage-induced apoptosis suppressor protein [Brachyhypopomus gauderio]|uniref:DNA damage-induced apoptosis suppressor protein n=1 Tax=Brachyhypopomus gauderio TaxID=698409 RepID=UPI004042C050